jgi:hypothetical protein
MLSADSALRQAHMTAHDYAAHAIGNLCELLSIDRRQPDWRKALEPWAPVPAAMIAAAASDFRTSTENGVIEGVGPNHTPDPTITDPATLLALTALAANREAQ